MALDTQVQNFTHRPLVPAIPGTALVTLAVKLAASTTFPKGSPIAESVATPGTFALYSHAGSDGAGTWQAILPWSCQTDAAGNITVGQNGDPAGITRTNVEAVFGGYVKAQDIPSLSTQTLTDGVQARLTKGTVTNGIVKIG